ncbi:MAG: hypothetical protein EOO38_14605 [Cytophagaceae bacterium]|nr:MAG: hypothetical protein EOO38_14605 [Cytophagaceae bacterium]
MDAPDTALVMKLLSSALLLSFSLFLGGCSGSSHPELQAVIEANAQASQSEDIDAYLKTIHPSSDQYSIAQGLLPPIFLMCDLKYRVESFQVDSVEQNDVHVNYVVITEKGDGIGLPYRDNKISFDTTLRKDGDTWKIFDLKPGKVEYLS